jgi:putative SOS response-associated peptidase YedK
MQPVHDRIPIILAQEDWETWLNPENKTDDALLDLLKPYDAKRMQAWPVSFAMRKVADQGEQLVQPSMQ